MYRLYLIVLFIFSLQLSAQAQQQKELSQVINSIEDKFNVTFSYDSEVIVGRKVSIEIDRFNTLTIICQELEKLTGLRFELIDEQHVLVKKQPSQKVSGCLILVDAETGEAVSGAFILQKQSPTFGAVSDANGRANFSGDLSASDSITIKGLGYLEQSVSISSIIGCPTIRLKPSVTKREDIKLSLYLTSGVNLAADDNGVEIKQENLALLPGETAGDVLQAIQVLPGITNSNGKSGTLNIRGSTTDQTLILLDEIPIYHKGHFYGTLSPFNSDIVESINVYRSGFHPKYGGRVAGTVDVRTESEVTDSLNMGLGINLLYGSGYLAAPLDKDKKLGVILGGRSFLPTELQTFKYKAIRDLSSQLTRYSTIDGTETVELTEENVGVQDVNGKIIYQPDSTQNFSVSMMNIFNRDDKHYLTNQPHRLRDLVELRNYGGSFIWKKKFKNHNKLLFTTVLSDYNYRLKFTRTNQMGVLLLDQDHNIIVKDLNSKVMYCSKMGSEKSKIDIGYEWIWQKAGADLYDRIDPMNFSESYSYTVAVQNVLFGNYQYQPTDKLKFSLGNRLVHYNAQNKIRPEPRINLSYKLNKYANLKASSGYYFQYLTQFVFFDFNDNRTENHRWKLADNDFPVVSNFQSMLGASFEKKGWLIDLETYSKQLNNLTIQAESVASVDEYSHGEGYTLGADLLLRKRWTNFDIWVSYTFNFTRWQFDSISPNEFRPYYDQPHIFQIAGTRSVDRWKFSASWSWRSGIPDQTVNTGFVIGPPGPPPPPPGVQYRGRYKNLHQLDISVLYELGVSKEWKGLLGLSIQNIYDQNNVIENGAVQFDPGSPLIAQDRSLIGFAPNVNFNIYW